MLIESLVASTDRYRFVQPTKIGEWMNRKAIAVQRVAAITALIAAAGIGFVFVKLLQVNEIIDLAEAIFTVCLAVVPPSLWCCYWLYDRQIKTEGFPLATTIASTYALVVAIAAAAQSIRLRDVLFEKGIVVAIALGVIAAVFVGLSAGKRELV